MVSPKFANVQWNDDHDSGAMSTGRKMTLPWPGQQKLLSSYRGHTLSEAGMAVGTDMGKTPSLSLGVSQLTNSEWLRKPSLSSASLLCDSAMCSVVNLVCLTTLGQDLIIYSVLVIEKCCPVDHSVGPRASGGAVVSFPSPALFPQ